MHIRTISYAFVTADYHQVKHLQDISYPTSRSQRFNTARHTRLEILPVVPESTAFTHEQPLCTAYGFVLWQPLISRSQNMKESYVFSLPSFLHQDLMRCHAAWVATNRLPSDLVKETVNTWQSTRKGKDIMKVLDRNKKWFIRLDRMSPKDSPFGGKLPTTTLEDVVIKICSSMRAWKCLQNERESAEKENRKTKVEMVLNLWDEDMDAGREFRVFVPPPAARGAGEEVAELKFSAISQYSWHLPFTYPFGWSVVQTAEAVCAGAQTVLGDIKVFMQEHMSYEVRRLLLQYGFSFDVALQQDGTVQLVEVNPFGALSGCGACLFNWMANGRMLYGLEESMEFVVTLDESNDKDEEGTMDEWGTKSKEDTGFSER